MTELLALLDQQAPLSPELKSHFLTVISVEEFPKRSHLLKAGHINTKVYFITKGLVRCYTTDNEGREECIWFLKEGDVIFPVEGFKNQTIMDENMQALEDVTVFSLPFMEFDRIFLEYPEFNFHGRRVSAHYSELWYTLFKELKMKTAAQRYQFLLDNFPELVRRVQNQYLASFLGISNSTFSRIRANY
jgi:CRP-like cAMP-binding protein